MGEVELKEEEENCEFCEFCESVGGSERVE